MSIESVTPSLKTELAFDISATFQNGSVNEEPFVSFPQNPKIVVTCTENDETSAPNGQCAEVSQDDENPDAIWNNARDNVELPETRVEPETNLDTCNGHKSFAIPDGLVMDPLAPTALAVSSTEFMDRIGSGLTLLREHGKKVQKYVWKNRKLDILKKSWKSVVNVVLIEAKDLPDGPTGNVYCKFRLGSEDHKSRQVSKGKPMWCERFNLHIYEETYLDVSVWLKGNQKNFMGRCTIDVSRLEKEKTHDVWQELECGFGSLHLLVTVSGSTRSMAVDNVPTTTGAHVPPPADDFSWYRLDNGWSVVGRLSVTVHGARGLNALSIIGKGDTFCVLELDNSRVQTHTVSGTSDPTWDKSYTFTVNDVTSTLDLTVYDESLLHEILGRVSIPLLRIENDEKRWYALKNRSKKSNAKGNCPRILLQMSLVWNPVKASLRVLSPREAKYSDYQKPNKFNIPLIYNNLKFIKDVFTAVMIGNEHFKYFLEWDNRELSATVLIGWLTFWLFFKMWMTPLLLVVPFAYCWLATHNINTLGPVQSSSEEDNEEDDLESPKHDKTLKNRIHGLKDLTLTIKNGIDFIVSLLERVKNLVNFSVPYLSYLAISAMVLLSAALCFLPINYLFMAFGIYKFGRRYMNPARIPNNDILDFISRVPDDAILTQWRELKVPEPSLSRSSSYRLRHNGGS